MSCSNLLVRASVIVLVLVGAMSCRRNDRPTLAPVRGQVLYRGQPVAGAAVTFSCEGSPRLSAGTTDAQGYFTLTTYDEGDGAVVGSNRATVARSVRPPAEAAGGVPDPEAYFRVVQQAEKKAEASPFPSRYADPKTSGLVIPVTAGSNSPVLELKD